MVMTSSSDGHSMVIRVEGGGLSFDGSAAAGRHGDLMVIKVPIASMGGTLLFCRLFFITLEPKIES